MDYFVYIVGVNHSLTLIFAVLTLKYSASVIFGNGLFQKSLKLSPVISFYFLYIFIWSVWSTLNCIYLLSLWRTNEIIYDSKTLFFLGFLPFVGLNIYPTMEFWLCVDRCFSVVFPLRYSTSQKKLLCCVILGCVAGIIALGSWANNLLMALEKDGPTQCRYFTCLMKSRSEQYIIKITISCMNFMCGCVLALLIKFVINNNNANAKGKNLNKTVLIIIFSTTVFDLVPNFMGQIFESFTSKPMSTYVGPYVTALSAGNTALCTFIYSRAFKKAFSTKQPSFQTPVQAFSHHSKMVQPFQNINNNNNSTVNNNNSY